MFAISELPGFGILIIPASKPKVFELFGTLFVNNCDVLVNGSISETVLLKKLFPGRIVAPKLSVTLIVLPFNCK